MWNFFFSHKFFLFFFESKKGAEVAKASFSIKKKIKFLSFDFFFLNLPATIPELRKLKKKKKTKSSTLI